MTRLHPPGKTTRLPPDFRPPTPSRRLAVRSADGTRLAVEVHEATVAEAPTVVLAHGWTCSTSFWVRVLHRLRGLLRVVVYDQRGHGRSEAVPPGGYTPSALADDLAAVLASTVSPGDRAVVAGHSMGAMSLIAFAGRHPQELHERVGAALLASTGVAQLVGHVGLLPQLPVPAVLATRRTPREERAVHGAPAARLRVVQAGLADARALHRLPLPVARAAINRLTLAPGATAAEREYNADVVLACPQTTYAGFAGMLADLDLRADLEALDVPALVLVGTRDRLTPPWHARGMAAALPHPRGVVEVPGAGHMTPLTAPDAVSDALRGLVPDAAVVRKVIGGEVA